MIPLGTVISCPLPSPFLSKLEFTAVQRDDDGEVVIKLTFPLGVKTRYGILWIPAGFLSDGASIPYLARAIAGDPFDLQYLAPAVVHDACYRKGHFDHLTRPQSDLIFKDLLWDTKVPKWKVIPFYAAVRVGGKFSFRKYDSIIDTVTS